jgi:hypothetical protein
VHDVEEVTDYLQVRAALRGVRELDPGLRIPDELRTEAAKARQSADR